MMTPCFRNTLSLLQLRVFLPRGPVLTAILRENQRSISLGGRHLTIIREASFAANNSGHSQQLLLQSINSKKGQQSGSAFGVSAACSLISGGLLLGLLLGSGEGSAGELQCEPIGAKAAVQGELSGYVVVQRSAVMIERLCCKHDSTGARFPTPVHCCSARTRETSTSAHVFVLRKKTSNENGRLRFTRSKKMRESLFWSSQYSSSSSSGSVERTRSQTRNATCRPAFLIHFLAWCLIYSGRKYKNRLVLILMCKRSLCVRPGGT